MKRAANVTFVSFGLIVAAAPVVAADEKFDNAAPPAFGYVIGASVARQPESAGARRYDTAVTPAWALRWGRWRLSGGGGSALLGFGQEVYGAGASTDLFDTDRLRVGVSLRLDSGRRSGDAETTRGLPDVRRTVRGRLFATYVWTDDMRVSGALSQDLLGREGGLIATIDLGWRLFRLPSGELTAGGGIMAGNGRYMQSYFGVPVEAAQALGIAAYAPGAGLRDIHAGLGYTRLLNRQWILFSGLGIARLEGPAADSPLTRERLGRYVSIGIAYRR